MSNMEHRSLFITTSFFLFLMLTLPYFSRGGSRSETLDSSEVYEIDYRGPETHSSIPPPDHSHGKSHSAHPQSSGGVANNVMVGSTGSAIMGEEKAKKVHE